LKFMLSNFKKEKNRNIKGETPMNYYNLTRNIYYKSLNSLKLIEYIYILTYKVIQ